MPIVDVILITCYFVCVVTCLCTFFFVKRRVDHIGKVTNWGELHLRAHDQELDAHDRRLAILSDRLDDLKKDSERTDH